MTKMSEEGMGYQEALDMATRLGYAEADPTADVEGYDRDARSPLWHPSLSAPA
mgnify:CR=1 FL=1